MYIYLYIIIHWLIVSLYHNSSIRLDLYIYHHHHVTPSAQISLTLSRYPSLSSIASGRSSGQHYISAQSCYMYVWAGHPAFARPCEGVHRNIYELVQTSPAVSRMSGLSNFDSFRTALWGAASRTCSILLATFLYSCHQAFVYIYIYIYILRSHSKSFKVYLDFRFVAQDKNLNWFFLFHKKRLCVATAKMFNYGSSFWVKLRTFWTIFICT